MSDILNLARAVAEELRECKAELLYFPEFELRDLDDLRIVVVPAGTQIRLTPGESLTITQGMYHDFEVEPGTGEVLIGEVSQCNDDANDNRFNPPAGRFPEIEEDEAPYRLLCNEYPPAKD